MRAEARIRAIPAAALAMLGRLAARHPDAHCELVHENPFQLLVAVVLSAQTTDVLVNQATPALFARYPDARALAGAKPKDVEKLVSRLGFFRQKTKSILGLSKALVEKHGGAVPRTLAKLVELRGVGRKTANVVLGTAFGIAEGVVVDTHVLRLAQRLGWTRHRDPENVEQDLMKLLPTERWNETAHVLVFHGRRVCAAVKPDCEHCPLNGRDGFEHPCPSAFRADNVGRKLERTRRRRPRALRHDEKKSRL